jgi:hypothetical protein
MRTPPEEVLKERKGVCRGSSEPIYSPQEHRMNNETHDAQDKFGMPVVTHPGPVSMDELLRNIDPAPDDETERFVALIYADRREAAGQSAPPE